ncbi:MAG: carboxypeptidase regulatory-like domain-containing protein, partial [Bryobacteraceae bacterium]|nr:carboxypeptidase regulatory-like domain-containing protein [Bryobacteraceae bacterium]
MSLSCWCKVTLAGLVAAGCLHAQRDTGSIQGTVTDGSGGVVPRAKVTIVSEGTGLTTSMETRDDGTFIFTPIRIGTYTIEAVFQGFQKYRRQNITVNIQQQLSLDLVLTPGELTQTVEVTTDVPILQTQSGSTGEVIEQKSIVNLPLNSRNYTFLARLTTGVTHGQPEGRGLNASGWFAANGTRPAQNNYLLDGIDNNSNNVDFLSGAAFVLRPPIDAIQEFKLQTSAFSAEFGRAGGAVLNATLRGGSNQYHGTLWEFLRNEKLDAADFFANANPRPGQDPRGPYKQNIFGAAGGGYIVRNKTFWFADYEGTRIRQAFPALATVPTALQRSSGFTNFSDLIGLQSGTRTDALNRVFPLGTIFDPSTTRQVGPGARDWIREPFPGNVIPASRLNPNAVKLMQLYPAPTGPGLNANYQTNRGSSTDVNAFDIRVDHNFSAKDQLFVRYSHSNREAFRPGPFEGIADGGGFNDGNEST